MKNFIFPVIIIGSLLLGGCLPLKTQTPPTNTKPNTSTNNPLKNQPTSDTLDLSHQGLKQIPSHVFGQTNLESLNVSNNQLTGSIQAEIRQLKNLKTLNASNNQMTGVPAEIGQLSHLEILDLSNNQLTGLPYELGNLQNLKTLNISGNNYSALDLDIITKKLPNDTNIIK